MFSDNFEKIQNKILLNFNKKENITEITEKRSKKLCRKFEKFLKQNNEEKRNISRKYIINLNIQKYRVLRPLAAGPQARMMLKY